MARPVGLGDPRQPGLHAAAAGHAVDELGAQRVTSELDARHTRSFEAVQRLGAQYDARLRNDRLSTDGTVRDRACFSVLAAEWPDVRAGLVTRHA